MKFKIKEVWELTVRAVGSLYFVAFKLIMQLDVFESYNEGDVCELFKGLGVIASLLLVEICVVLWYDLIEMR